MFLPTQVSHRQLSENVLCKWNRMGLHRRSLFWNVRNPRFHGTNYAITVILAKWSALRILKISSYHTIFSYFQYLTVYQLHNSLLTNFTLIFTYDIQDCPKSWLFIPEREFVKWMATDWPGLFSSIVPSFSMTSFLTC